MLPGANFTEVSLDWADPLVEEKVDEEFSHLHPITREETTMKKSNSSFTYHLSFRLYRCSRYDLSPRGNNAARHGAWLHQWPVCHPVDQQRYAARKPNKQS